MTDDNVILSIQNVSISYLTPRGPLRAVNRLSVDLHRGETLALIGESGCGKSTLNFGLMRLLPNTARVDSGQMMYTAKNGQAYDVLKLRPRALRNFRWSETAMVFQAAQNSLNPVIRIRSIFQDTARAHGVVNERDVDRRAHELLEMVRLEAGRVYNAYPHELSGGMRQRVLIALALLLDPQVLILDEPTTALDILTQRTILDVIQDLKVRLGFSVIFISHDLAIAAEIADTVATMYAGEIVEQGPVYQIFYQPQHAYTFGLMEATPRITSERADLESIPGSPPDLIDPPAGCKFHPRCKFAIERCKTDMPELIYTSTAHRVACFSSDEVLAQAQHNQNSGEAE